MIISVKNLVVKYKDLIAVNDISFEVNKGEIFGIIGPNGAGKTSTLECMEGLRKCENGEIEILGINPKNRKELYKHIGVQLQETTFPEDVRVGEMCKLFESFYDEHDDYMRLLKIFDLSSKTKVSIKKLSGGQKQKLSIILALISKPEVLFLDELTTGLDPVSRKMMWDVIKHLQNEGKTIILTTHFMEEAEYLCDRICLIADGKISAMGTIPELIKSAAMPIRISITTPAKIDKILEYKVEHANDKIIISGTGTDMIYTVLEYLHENRIIYADLDIFRPTLEDMFLAFTGKELGGKK